MIKYKTLFPEIEQYRELLTQENVNIPTLVNAIKHVNRRALSFFMYTQNQLKKLKSLLKQEIMR